MDLEWRQTLAIVVGRAMTAAIGLNLFHGSCSFAQITPDATLPNNSNVNLNLVDNTFNITGGTETGGNLFHSFKEFSVPKDSTAFFDNGTNIQNIINRVTGGSISNIDGLIKANGSANLFLVNPSGIVFGENARLDIGGSFVGSTADSLFFENGFEFSAVNPRSTPLLTVKVPLGLQFGENPQNIRVEGVGGSRSLSAGLGLRVSPGKTLALVGGNIFLEGVYLNTPQGQIELGSIAETGRVNLKPLNEAWTLNYENVQNFGNIDINRSFIDIAIPRNSGINILNEDSAISIRAAQLDIRGVSIISANTLTEAPGGDINIDVSRLIMEGGANVSARTTNLGEAGTLTVNATEFVKLAGTSPSGFTPTALSSSTNRQGKAGSLIINTNELSILDGAVARASTFGSGEAGEVILNVKKLLVGGGSQISAGSFRGGKGGSLIVNADKVELIGTSVNGDNVTSSGLFTQAQRGGNAGDLVIDTRELIVRDGATVSTAVFGSGKGGNLIVNADKVEITGTSAEGAMSNLRSIASDTGDAGNLIINIKDLLLKDGATISTESLGIGTAGNLTINARSINLDNQGLLSADTRSATINPDIEEATININSQDLILRRNSNITTNAAGENVIGGNINIDTDILAAFENSDITANSANFRGGNVIINSTGVFGTQFRDTLTFQSDITATGANPELSGNVELNTLDNQIEEQPQLPADIRQAEFDQRCSSGGEVAQNSFTIPGRGGLPPSPNQTLNSSSPWEDWRIVEDNNSSLARVSDSELSILKKTSISSNKLDKKSQRIVEATGWIVDKHGNIEFVAKTNQTNPKNPWTIPNCNVSG